MNSSEILSSVEVVQIRHSLMQERNRILNSVNAFRDSQKERNHLSDEDDVAAQSSLDNIAIHLQEKDREDLLKVDKALARLEDPAFGQCESCGDEIGLRRILANLSTTTCIACKEEQESKRSH